MNRIYWLIPTLIVLTLAVMLTYELGMEKTLAIKPGAGFEMEYVVDSAGGGKTTATLSETANAWTLDCQVDAEAHAWPYCELLVILKRVPDGLDLSHYKQVRIQAGIVGPGRPGLRTYLRNFDPAYSRRGRPITTKVNQIAYNPADYANDLLIPMESFQVASWWAHDNRIPIQHAGSQFDNVSHIEVATGPNVVTGNYTITLEGITFYGKWLERDTLYLLIIGFWLSTGAGYLLYHLVLARRDLERSWLKQSELEQINLALKLRSKQLKDESRRDPLTGVRNRAGLRQVLPRWINAVNERRGRLSLIFMDIDHFKAINDSFGHMIGDEILKEFCQLCSENIRQEDVLVRWGGEEFALLCPNTSESDTEQLANKLCATMRHHNWPERAEITCSFGVTEYSAADTPETFFDRADQALYKAKDHGRDRVVTLNCPEPIDILSNRRADEPS